MSIGLEEYIRDKVQDGSAKAYPRSKAMNVLQL